jgi:hypothetical protein
LRGKNKQIIFVPEIFKKTAFFRKFPGQTILLKFQIVLPPKTSGANNAPQMSCHHKAHLNLIIKNKTLISIYDILKNSIYALPARKKTSNCLRYTINHSYRQPTVVLILLIREIIDQI